MVCGKQSFRIVVVDEKLLPRDIFEICSVKLSELLTTESRNKLLPGFGIEVHPSACVLLLPYSDTSSHGFIRHLSPIIVKNQNLVSEVWMICNRF
jgi:hypothetical protein